MHQFLLLTSAYIIVGKKYRKNQFGNRHLFEFLQGHEKTRVLLKSRRPKLDGYSIARVGNSGQKYLIILVKYFVIFCPILAILNL